MTTQKIKHTEEWIPLSIGSKPYGYIALSGDPTLPAIGGCRILEQPYSEELSKTLSMDLARTMNKKSSSAHLGLSGGKTVLFIEDAQERPTLLMHYAEVVNRLQGRYITAIDIGSSQEDMDFISTITPYVTCHTAVGGDPSPYTAQTVLQGAMTAHAILNKTEPKHVVVQGLGKVGSELVQLLSTLYPKVRVSGTDIEPSAMKKVKALYPQCNLLEPDSIYHTACDIFISAGNSYVIDETIARILPCSILAIAANNALTHEARCEAIFKERGIVVLPDYLINSGGVMCCAHQCGLIPRLDPYLEANRADVALYVKQTALVATV